MTRHSRMYTITSWVVIFTLLMTMIPHTHHIYAEFNDDFDFKDNGDGTATITGYKGLSKEVEIPDKIDGLDVTGIGDRVFFSKNITSVMLPNTVKTIGNDAFNRNQLTSITLPNSVTSIGSNAFRKNQLENLTLGENIAYIGSQAFANNKLKKVAIPKSLATIGPYVFDDNEMTELIIPDNVTNIDIGAFRNNRLTRVTVMNASTNIHHLDSESSLPSSFAGNQVNPADLTLLGYDPSTAKTYALANGHSFISFNQPDYQWIENDNDTITITGYVGTDKALQLPSIIDGKFVTHIGDEAFSGKGLTSINIPDSVTQIGEKAFQNNQIETVRLGKNIARIENDAFANNKITAITIPNQVTSIGERAFHDNKITTIKFGSGLTTIEDQAFSTNQLTSVLFPENVVNIGVRAFESNPQLMRIEIRNKAVVIQTNAFAAGQTDPSAVMMFGHDPSEVKEYAIQHGHKFIDIYKLPEDVFTWKDNEDGTATITGLKRTEKEIEIPTVIDGLRVTNIGKSAFSNKKLTSVVIPDGVETIEANAFTLNDFESVTIPNSVRQIGNYAFSSGQLKNVELGSGITHIGFQAFRKNQLDNLILPDSVTTMEEGAFSWNPLTNVQLGKGLKTIEKQVFMDHRLTSVTIPDNVTRIEEAAFHTGKLTSVVIPNSVEYIGNYAFAFNELISVTIPENVVSVEESAFLNNKLTHVELGNGVKSIGKNAFSQNQLKSISLPNSVNTVEEKAFQFNNLKTVVVRNKNTYFGADVFFRNQHYPSSLTIIGYDSSTANDYASQYGYRFMNGEGEVSFVINGNSEWSKSHMTNVLVSGYDETKLLQFAWAKDTTPPNDHWMDFPLDGYFSTPTETGEYYLHVRGTNLFGDIFNYHSAAFNVDNTNPSLTITPNTMDTTHNDVVLTVIGKDNHSGVKRIQDPEGNWHNQVQMTYNAKHNGMYTFVVEDHAGNQATESVTISNIDKTISFEIPTIPNKEDIILNDKNPTHALNLNELKVKDWRDGDNDWRINISASRLKMFDGNYELPAGTLKLRQVSEIKQVAGNGNLPRKSTFESKEIDAGKVTIATATNSQGEFDFIFPESALEFWIDPTTIIIDTPNGTAYETTLMWDLITAP